jgi:hypothetical protein
LAADGSTFKPERMRVKRLRKSVPAQPLSMIREIAGDIDSFHTEFMSYVRLVEISGDLDTIKDTMMARRALANVKNRRSEGDEAFLNLRKSAMEKNNALTMAGTLISLLGVEPLEGLFPDIGRQRRIFGCPRVRMAH